MTHRLMSAAPTTVDPVARTLAIVSATVAVVALAWNMWVWFRARPHITVSLEVEHHVDDGEITIRRPGWGRVLYPRVGVQDSIVLVVRSSKAITIDAVGLEVDGLDWTSVPCKGDPRPPYRMDADSSGRFLLPMSDQLFALLCGHHRGSRKVRGVVALATGKCIKSKRTFTMDLEPPFLREALD